MPPLDSVRVLDLSRLLPGPYATFILHNLGARIDKVEDIKAGDYLRNIPPMVDDQSAAFHLINRGKRSLAIDLKSQKGREVFLKMLPQYDVLVESFRPGVLKNLGLDPEELLKYHSPLVVCSITGFGQSGKDSGRAGHDLNFLARSGLLDASVSQKPSVPSFQLVDSAAALWAVIAIMSALFERIQTGKGKWIDLSMIDSAVGFSAWSIASAILGNQQTTLLDGGTAVYNIYQSLDGEWFTLAALEPKFWKEFCVATGMKCDFSALLPGPHQHALIEEVKQVFRSKSKNEWISISRKHDCCLEPVQKKENLLKDPYFTDRGILGTSNHNQMNFPWMRTPIQVGSAPIDTNSSPHLGEHSVNILKETGFTNREVESLLASGTVVQFAEKKKNLKK